MPFYNYYCDSCDDLFEELVPMSKFKDPHECPSCGCMCEKTVEGQTFNAHGVGLKDGFGKASNAKVEKAWMEQEVKNTENAIKGETGASPYSRMSMNMDVLEKQGRCKRVSAKEAAARKKSAKKLTQDAARNLNAEDLKTVTRPDRADSK